MDIEMYNGIIEQTIILMSCHHIPPIFRIKC